ncbi:MAG: hypothetical protein ACSLE3_12130 [Microbacteriaceae bacterium]
MKLVAEAGLWTTGPQVSAPPAVAVLEVSGAVLEWPVDGPAGTAKLTFTDVAAADWLWRVAGERGHVAVVEAVRGKSAEPQASIDIADLELSAQALAPLRRLAVGHWLRRWWPASIRDGIADLDIAVLDAELAVLTAAAQDYFAEDTLDSDIDGLLRPHREALAAHLRDGDPRVAVLVEQCLELADWSDLAVEAIGERRRDDYALAAGDSGPGRSGAIASGSASVSWSAVPPGVFDAAEDTVTWSAAADGAGAVTAQISIEIGLSAAGVPVSLRSGELRADGVLDARGRAALVLPVAESVAWNRDWSATEISIGGPADPGESRVVRDRIRVYARSRLTAPAADAFLAEILAAEADY